MNPTNKALLTPNEDRLNDVGVIADAKLRNVIPDETSELISILNQSLRGYEKCVHFAADAEEAGDNELFLFFSEIQNENLVRAKRAQDLLAKRLCTTPQPGDNGTKESANQA